GGGAIKGIGESFSPDLHTGTGNLTVPITVPAGRNKLQPDLSLVYSTGRGNGPFGMGWAMNVPNVVRDTSKGVPTYHEGDMFALSGSESLVPVGPDVQGMRYRPRTEGSFARIVHVQSDSDDYWDVSARNGLRNLYGRPGVRGTDHSVVHDPQDVLRVFSWS